MKTKFAEDNAFTPAQAIDIGLRSGNLSTMELLTMLTKHAATNNDDNRKLKGGKHQGKLRSALNLYIANRYADSIVPPNAGVDARCNNPFLRAFIAQRSPTANRWLNRIHRDKRARLLTDADVKIAFWITAGINLIVVDRKCSRCKMDPVNWFEHGQVCKKSRKRRQDDNQVKYFARSWALHKSIQILMNECLAKIPDVNVTEQNPKFLDTFLANPENPPPPSKDSDNSDDQNHVDEEMEPRIYRGRVVADGTLMEDKRLKSDIKIITTFEEQPVPILIDITVAATHAVSHHPLTIKGTNGDIYSSRLADHGAHMKDKRHAHYLHDGNAIGFAFDSMGGISKSAKDLIDHLYARGEQEKRRRWDSETMRVALKKEFLDRLSMVLCIHRVYDFKFLGIPNMRAQGAQLAHPPHRTLRH